jgi:hypothetical protein
VEIGGETGVRVSYVILREKGGCVPCLMSIVILSFHPPLSYVGVCAAVWVEMRGGRVGGRVRGGQVLAHCGLLPGREGAVGHVREPAWEWG